MNRFQKALGVDKMTDKQRFYISGAMLVVDVMSLMLLIYYGLISLNLEFSTISCILLFVCSFLVYELMPSELKPSKPVQVDEQT
jgi:hypothetical protein